MALLFMFIINFRMLNKDKEKINKKANPKYKEISMS